jgi:WD40 repeat protein
MTALVVLLLIAQNFQEHAAVQGHKSLVSSVSFSFDSELLATGSSDNTVKIWDVASARELSTLDGHGTAVQLVRFSPNGTLLTSVDSKGKIILWDRVDKVYKSSKSYALQGIGDIFKFDQQEVGKLAIISSNDRERHINTKIVNASIIDTKKGENIVTLKHNQTITSVAISPDGAFISFGDDQGVIRIFSCSEPGNLVEINSFTCPLSEDGDLAIPMAIAIHPQMKILAFGCDDNKIRLWRWSDAAPFATLEGHTKWIDHIAISTDGDYVVSGSHDFTLSVWSTKTQENLQTIQSQGYVCSISLSQNNKYISYGNHKGYFYIYKRSL